MTSTAMRQGSQLDDLIDQRRHGIDAGIARAEERDLLALPGELDGVAHAILFVTEREAVKDCSWRQVGARSR